GGDIAVIFGDGTGHFTERVDLTAAPWPPTFADMNGDGRTDIVVTGAVFKNAGRTFARINAPFNGSLAIADLNGDGAPDVVTGASVSVERADRIAGPWLRLDAPRAMNGETVVQMDLDVQPNQAYWYRLVALNGGQTVVIAGPLEVRAIAFSRFAITDVSPNP